MYNHYLNSKLDRISGINPSRLRNRCSVLKFNVHLFKLNNGNMTEWLCGAQCGDE